MKTILLVICVYLAAGTAFPQKGDVPRFEDFPVPRKFAGKPAPVNLNSHPKARKYRTMLRAAAKEGANFAGHYIVTYWGCGSNCRQIAFIDASNGNVYFSPELPSLGVGFDFGENEEDPLQFKLESKLLIAEGLRFFHEDEHPEIGKFYFKWENNRLKLIYKVEKRWIRAN